MGPTRRSLLAALAMVAAGRRLLEAQRQYPEGLLLVDDDGPQELGAYAVLRPNGRLTMAFGTRDDILAAPRIPMIVCNLGLWPVGAVWVTSDAIFEDARAERRQLPFSVNRASVRTTRLRIGALEDPANIRRLAHAIGAGPGRSVYAVFTTSNGPMTRHYLVRIVDDEAR